MGWHEWLDYSEGMCPNGPLGPVFAKNHNPGVIFDTYCDRFCANPVNVSKSVLPVDRIGIYRDFN